MSSFLNFEQDAAIVVTGAGSGIGASTATMAAAQGLKVAAWDLSDDAAQTTAETIAAGGGTALAIGLDVSDHDAVGAAWDRTLSELGTVRYLASVAGPPSFIDRDFDAAIELCLKCMREPIEAWIARCPLEERSVVLFGSMQGTYHGAGADWYTVGKAAIDGYTRSLASMRPGGIRANAILPDWTITPRTAPYAEKVAPDGVWRANPMGRMGYPEDCAAAALFFLSPAAGYLNGVALPVDGGVRLRPAAWLMANDMV